MNPRGAMNCKKTQTESRTKLEKQCMNKISLTRKYQTNIKIDTLELKMKQLKNSIQEYQKQTQPFRGKNQQPRDRTLEINYSKEQKKEKTEKNRMKPTGIMRHSEKKQYSHYGKSRRERERDKNVYLKQR